MGEGNHLEARGGEFLVVRFALGGVVNSTCQDVLHARKSKSKNTGDSDSEMRRNWSIQP